LTEAAETERDEGCRPTARTGWL